MVIPFFIFSNIVQLFYDKMQRKITCKQIQSMLYLLYITYISKLHASRGKG